MLGIRVVKALVPLRVKVAMPEMLTIAAVKTVSANIEPNLHHLPLGQVIHSACD